MSPRRRLPNRLPDRSDDSGGPLGRNLPPLTQVSSVSAGPRGAGSRGPGPGPGPGPLMRGTVAAQHTLAHFIERSVQETFLC